MVENTNLVIFICCSVWQTCNQSIGTKVRFEFEPHQQSAVVFWARNLSLLLSTGLSLEYVWKWWIVLLCITRQISGFTFGVLSPSVFSDTGYLPTKSDLCLSSILTLNNFCVRFARSCETGYPLISSSANVAAMFLNSPVVVLGWQTVTTSHSDPD